MRLVLFALATLFATTCLAATPYPPEINARFKKLEAVADTPLPTANGLQKMKVARVAFDATTMNTSGSTYSLGVTLPANAVIWDGMIYTSADFTAGTGTVALQCEDAGNIMAAKSATALSTKGTKTALTPVGTAASAVVGIAAACNISAVVATANLTAGKFVGWIEYFVAE